MASQFVRGIEMRGLAFPITKGREGYWPRRNSNALRQSSIAMILGTRRGERVGEPEFGSNLHDLIFEPLDDTTLEQVRQETVVALSRWDPMIVVLGVTTETQDDQIHIFIDYKDRSDIRATEQRRSVVTFRR